MNYWYSARPDEIFLDLDSHRAIARALSVLRCAIRKKDLLLREMWLFPTKQRGHAHMILVLNEKLTMNVQWKTAWSLWLGSDRLRASYSLARNAIALAHTDLLVSDRIYHRVLDGLCECKGKHKEKKITENCPAMRQLLGEHAGADYFTRTGHWPTRRKIRIPWGRVTKKQLIAWKEK